MDGGHAVFAAIPVANKLHEEAAKHLALVCVKHASVTFESGMLENANEIKPIVWNEPVTFTLTAVIFRTFHFADLFYRNCLFLLCVKEREYRYSIDLWTVARRLDQRKDHTLPYPGSSR